MLPVSETNEPELPPPDEDFEEQIVAEVPVGEVTLILPTEATESRMARLHGKARALEQIPGVYLLKDARDVVIYVGKSRSLRDRVSSYFIASTDLGPVKQRLLDYVVDFDILTCDSEVEALLIESRLIKDLHPRFNARLSDGKSYPYLEITTREDFPRCICHTQAANQRHQTVWPVYQRVCPQTGTDLHAARV